MLSKVDLEKWQKAIQGIETGQNALSAEELFAFQTLKELFKKGNFESSKSDENIKIIKDALASHNNHRLLKAHLINFVVLCENIFKVEVKTKASEPKQEKPKQEKVLVQNQVDEVENLPVSKEKKRKKKRKAVKIIITITVSVILCIAGVVAVLFSGKITALFDGTRTSNSLIPVSSNGERWGYINHKGEYVINPQFDDADFFSDGLAKVRSDGKIGYINTKGEFIIPATYKDGTAFNNSLAFVVPEGGHPTCINKSGKTRFVLNDAEYVSVFSDSLAVLITKSGEYGFVDKNKQITINQQFKVVGNFSEGKAPFYDGKQWGYINTNGTYAINPQFDYAYPFSNGLAVIRLGTSFGYVNKDGKLVINPQFASALSFSEGLAGAKQGLKYGYINKDGKWVIASQFEFAGEFNNGIAPVYNVGKWGFINKREKYVVSPQFIAVKIKDCINNERIDFIQSDYYNASTFVKRFINKCTGNSFDCINASTTLLKLANHQNYGAYVDDISPNIAICRKSIVITQEISIYEIVFYFKEPMYEEVPNYDYWGNQKGTKKGDYNFNVNTVAIQYNFNLIGKAVGKETALAVALKTEIETLYKLQMQSKKGIHYLYQDDGKLNFAIIFEPDSGISFIVAFSKAGLEMFFREKGIRF